MQMTQEPIGNESANPHRHAAAGRRSADSFSSMASEPSACVGADEPRYAQVAREMLDRSDWVTPTLQGKPWLEKPALYYWQAMLSFRVAGVTDQAARLPAAFDAAVLIAAIYFFLRRFRPGSELDGALITASCAGVIGFAHAAATDMPLAAAFAIALLAWYAWYESRRHIYLAAFYISLALGTLAKGPVAPALAAVIIFLFVAVKRDWRAIPRTLWIPGIAALSRRHVALVYRRPTAQSGILPLLHPRTQSRPLLAGRLSPPPAFLVLLARVLAGHDALDARAHPRRRRARSLDYGPKGKEAFSSPEDSWPLFLLIWMLVPILFFSASQSKLPGYILPAVPAGALLVAEYLAGCGRGQFFNAEGAEVSQRSRDDRKLSLLFAAAHGVLCGVLIFAALSAASIAINHHLLWGTGTWVAAAIAAVFCARHRHCATVPRRLASAAAGDDVRRRGQRRRRHSSRRARHRRHPIRASHCPRAFRPFRTNRSPSPSITSIACRDTASSFISIVRRNHTRAEIFRPQLMCWLPHKVRNPKSPNSFPDAECHT